MLRAMLRHWSADDPGDPIYRRIPCNPGRRIRKPATPYCRRSRSQRRCRIRKHPRQSSARQPAKVQTMLKKYILWNIRVYQQYISPKKGFRCPYRPSCSNYAREAVEKYGAWRGGLLALRRLLRCVPWTKGGNDPVPELKKKPGKHMRIRRLC